MDCRIIPSLYRAIDGVHPKLLLYARLENAESSDPAIDVPLIVATRDVAGGRRLCTGTAVACL